MKHLIKSFVAAATALLFGGAAQAALTIDVLEFGDDVVLEVYGTLDTTGLVEAESIVSSGEGIRARAGHIFILDGRQPITVFQIPTPFSAFGVSDFIIGTASGDPFAIVGDRLWLAQEPLEDFMPGDVVNSVLTFTDMTIAMMGLNEGTTVFALTNDTITLNIGDVDGAVPVPAAALLFAPVLAGLAVRRRRA